MTKLSSINMHKAARLFQEHSQVEAVKTIPEQKPQYGDICPPLPPRIKEYLAQNGSIKLYAHQVEVLARTRAGENVVLVTSTASGKTLAFCLPVLEHLWEDSQATALFLYPMKALAYDQLQELRNMVRGTGINLQPAVYDGDTPRVQRREIRHKSRIILSNPHAFHRYLSWHRLWRRFFRNLKYIVLDEAHWYRGVFGSNVAYLLRRLQRILDYYGNPSPQFILASATMADPAEHAWRLTGRDFTLVNNDGSARGKKTYFFWDTSRNPDRSPHLQTADLFVDCMRHDLQTLCFTVSRKMSELTARWAREEIKEVASYRAGYLPAERRELERKFKKGELKGLASTNALELGINIGGLDAVVMGGYPGTVSSFHQQSGRAGRTGSESLVLQVLYDNPLDAYLLANPDYLFQEPSEQAVVSLDNEHILKNHLLCAAEEYPLTAGDSRWFGPEYVGTVQALVKEKKLRAASTAYVYNGKNACFQVDMASFDSDTYLLVYDGEVLEELNQRQAYTEAHPGAVFMHKTEPYRIKSFNHEQKIIEAEPATEDCFTQPLTDTTIGVIETLQKKESAPLTLCYGKVLVTEDVHGYLLKSKGKVLGQEGIQMPPMRFETKAAWLQLSLREIKGDIAGGLHAAEHLLIAVTPLMAMCDRWDIGGVSITRGENELFIYDGYPGGVGIAKRLFEHYRDLAAKALEVGRRCSCEDGCPRCIMSPKCGNNNDPLDKEIALRILEKMLAGLEQME